MTRDEMRGTPISMCEFPSNRARIARHLKYDGIDTLGKLIDATHARLRGVRALGSISLRSINDFLASIGERRKEPGKDGEGRLSADDIRDAMSSDGVSPTLRSSIFDAISAERSRQDEEHGQTLAIDRIPAVLGEEYGEVCRSLNDKEPMRRLVAELVQCAAVCVKAIESIDRAGMRVLRVDEESAMRAGTIRNVAERDAERHRAQCMWPEEHDFVSTSDGDFACTKCTMRRGATAIAAMQSLGINTNRAFDYGLVNGGDE